MKYFNIFILILLVPSFQYSQVCKAKIILSCGDHNAEYFLNGEKQGSGKLINIELNRGVYLLKISEVENYWDPLVIYDTLNINECAEYLFEYKFPMRNYLQTDPMDAYVYRGDTLLGSTPLFITDANGLIKITKPGYKDLAADINNLHGVLKLEKTFGKSTQSFYERDLFRYLVGGLIILGGTTAYFKLMADDKFERYQITGDNNLLDDTRKYDLISGITFGALQINFGILLYYLLSE